MMDDDVDELKIWSKLIKASEGGEKVGHSIPKKSWEYFYKMCNYAIV